MKATLRELAKISVPSFLDSILFSLAIMIDTMMIGKIGPAAIAAVGIMFQPLLILRLFTEAIMPGVTYHISRSKGKGDRLAVAQITAQAGLVTAGISVFFLVLGLLATEPILLFMKAGFDTRDYAATYWRCVLAGFTPFCLKLVLSTALIAVGESKKVMWINLTSSASNLALNYLLIYGKFGFPALGVLGAGIATAFSFYLACICCIAVFFSGKSYIDLRGLGRIILDKDIISSSASIGGPAILGRLAIRISVLIMTRTVFALGTAVFAAYQICSRFHDIAMFAGMAMGKAVSSLTGQSLGAEQPELAEKYVKYACVCIAAVTLLMNTAVVVFSKPLTALFSDDPFILAITLPSLLILLFFQPFQGMAETLSGGLLAHGDTKSKFIATLIGIIAIRLSSVYLLTNVILLGLAGVWIAHAIDEIFRFIYLAVAYKRRTGLTDIRAF